MGLDDGANGLCRAAVAALAWNHAAKQRREIVWIGMAHGAVLARHLAQRRELTASPTFALRLIASGANAFPFFQNPLQSLFDQGKAGGLACEILGEPARGGSHTGGIA